MKINRRQAIAAASVAGAGLWLPASARGQAPDHSTRGTKKLKTLSESPFNAEPPLAELVESFLTPEPLFYVRSHAPNPLIDVASFRLTVTGMVERELSLSLAELQRDFPKRTVLATMTCAGNRRTEHSRVKPVSGVQWGAGAIGTANWSGAALQDVLLRAGVKAGASHVWFEGLDEVQRGDHTIGFGGSIPLGKAQAGPPDYPEALVCYHMNGAPLPLDHGYPLRMVAPGFIGTRSVKWLGKIVVSDRPSPNHYVAGAYKLVADDTSELWEQAEPLYHYYLNSVICSPARSARLEGDKIMVRGYALPSGDDARNQVARVLVSVNDTRKWRPAKLLDPPRPFCWRRWEIELELNEAIESIVVQAIDGNGGRQPETTPWNAKGYMFNAWHRVPIRTG